MDDVSSAWIGISRHRLRTDVSPWRDDFGTRSTDDEKESRVELNVSSLTFTCVSVRFNDAENSARSVIVKYCLSRNFFSRASNCEVVKGVRGFRFCLCLRNEQIFALILGSSLLPERERDTDWSISFNARPLERAPISLLVSDQILTRFIDDFGVG